MTRVLLNSRAHGKTTLAIRNSIDRGGVVWIASPRGLFMLATTANPYYPCPKAFVKKYMEGL